MAVTLSTKNIGDIVKIRENSNTINFIIVHKGRPSTIYDAASFNSGVIVMRQDVLPTRKWHSSNLNDYENSDMHKWLNDSYLSTISQNIRDQIRQVRIPFRAGSGTSLTVTSGTKGLQCHVFLAGAIEVGVISDSTSPVDGAKFDYFLLGNNIGDGAQLACQRRKAIRSGIAAEWWLRTPYSNGSTYTWIIFESGLVGSYNASYSGAGPRPAFVLPSTLLVNDNGYVFAYSAPNVPSSITIPTTINGGVSFKISWGASSDPNEILTGYKLERNLNGGNWSQIYQANSRSTTDTVPFGTSTVAYRVRAYDSEGEHSAYQTSPTRTVINNTAPTTPPSISVPTIVIGGGNLVITWNSSTDAEGNLSGYVLERTSNGGTSWTQIYKGANLSYTDAITKGWPTVQYRVKAYDSYDLESDWRTSVARTVDNSVAPTITSTASGDLGLKSDGFTWGYIIGQDDNETVTVVESMDDVQKRSYTAALGASNTFDVTGQYFMKLLNGSRSMKVTATASSGKSATHTVTFTKGVYSCSITMTAPLPADALIKKMVMNITRSIPADAAYTVQVTNNANDPSPVWEDITNNIQLGLNHVFANATAVNGSAFNFKITASRGLGNTGGFVSAIGGAFE